MNVLLWVARLLKKLPYGIYSVLSFVVKMMLVVLLFLFKTFYDVLKFFYGLLKRILTKRRRKMDEPEISDLEPPDLEPPDLTSPDSDDNSQKLILWIARAFVLLLYGAFSFVPPILFIVYVPQARPYSALTLLISPIFWFWVFFVSKVGETEIAVLVRLGKPIRIVKRGPMLMYGFIDKMVRFSLESRKELVGSAEDEEGPTLDIYTKDRKYIVIKMELVWRVVDPLKYLINKIIVEDGVTIKGFMIAAVRKYCGSHEMEPILENGKKELPIEIINDLTPLFVDWGIEGVGDPRIIDLDPIVLIKQEMKDAAAAVYNKVKTIVNAEAQAEKTLIDAEAQKEQRIKLAVAQEKEGFTQAAIDAKEVELRQKARIEALGISKGEEAVKYDLTEKMITEAFKNIDNLTVFDGTAGIVKIIQEAIKSFKDKE